MIELAVAVQMKGWGSAFDSRRYWRMARMSSANQRSTGLSRKAEVGVKCRW